MKCYLALISLNINFHNNNIRLNSLEYVPNSDGLDWRLQDRNVYESPLWMSPPTPT